MSIRAITYFLIECNECDRVFEFEDDSPQLFESRHDAMNAFEGGPEFDEDNWLVLPDGRVFCERHFSDAPFVQTGPDLFDAATDLPELVWSRP